MLSFIHLQAKKATGSCLHRWSNDAFILHIQVGCCGTTSGGHPLISSDYFVAEVVHSFVLDENALSTPLSLLSGRLAKAEREKFFKLIVTYACRKYLSTSAKPHIPENDDKTRVSGIAAMIATLVILDRRTKQDAHLVEFIVNWICSSNAESRLHSFEARRAMIAGISDYHGMFPFRCLIGMLTLC